MYLFNSVSNLRPYNQTSRPFLFFVFLCIPSNDLRHSPSLLPTRCLYLLDFSWISSCAAYILLSTFSLLCVCLAPRRKLRKRIYEGAHRCGYLFSLLYVLSSTIVFQSTSIQTLGTITRTISITNQCCPFFLVSLSILLFSLRKKVEGNKLKQRRAFTERLRTG